MSSTIRPLAVLLLGAVSAATLAAQDLAQASPNRTPRFLLETARDKTLLDVARTPVLRHRLSLDLADASIDRSSIYLTNAVKHFKFVRGRNGKTRLHKTPSRGEVAACRQWWERELESVQPTTLGLLGATAAQAVLGPAFRVSKQRGEPFELPSGMVAIATIHPSAVLRAQDRKDEMLGQLTDDLRVVAKRLRIASRA